MGSVPYLLEVWKGDWNLPSVDTQCLRVMAYSRFSDAPLELLVNNSPWTSPGEEYPILHDPKSPIKIIRAENIINYLENLGAACPHELTSYEKADAHAIEKYLSSAIVPLLDYLWWVDEETFRRLTSLWYRDNLPLYGQAVWMHLQRRKATKRILTTIDAHVDPDKVEAVRKRIVEKARGCLESLSTRLADKTFIFGLKPSSLDATLFAYLAPLFYVPWKNKDVRKELYFDSLDKFKNLKLYVDRIRKRYFEGNGMKTQVVSYPRRWYDKLFDGIRSHRDVIIFTTLAIFFNAILLRKAINRLRFRWPGFDEHARQKMQESIELIRNLGLGPEFVPDGSS